LEAKQESDLRVAFLFFAILEIISTCTFPKIRSRQE